MDIRGRLERQRMTILNRLDDVMLTESINGYFAKNATMPGEDWVKTEAAATAEKMEKRSDPHFDPDSPDFNPGDLYPSETRDEMKEKFASILVKNARLKNVMVRPVMDMADVKFPDSETASDGKIHYELYGITDPKAPGHVIFAEGVMTAEIPEKFMKNHPETAGTVVIEAVDYSNGKGKNVSYDMYIDLAQNDKFSRTAAKEKSPKDRMEELHEAWVPGMGNAPTVAGEMIRAVNRIGYRYYNDGDRLGDGYGRETVNPAGRYLLAKGTPEVKEALEDMWAPYTGYDVFDDEYEGKIDVLCEKVLDQLEKNPELFSTRNTEDMHKFADPSEDYDDSFEDEDEYEEDYEDEEDEEDEDEYDDFADAVDSIESEDGLQM